MTATDPDVAAQQPATVDTADVPAAVPVDPVVRIGGELAGRLLASARWQQ